MKIFLSLIISSIIIITICIYTSFCDDNIVKIDDVSSKFSSEIRKNMQSSHEIPLRYDTFRMGPILLKCNDEWFTEDDKGKFLYIGISKRNIDSEDYTLISPKALSVNSSESILYPEADSDEINKIEIYKYKVKCNTNQFWIDLYLLLQGYYNEVKKTNIYYITEDKKFYIYHPITKKWWGIHYLTSNTNEILQVFNTDLYNESNNRNQIENFLAEVNDKRIKEYIVSERTFILPSMKFYEEKFGELVEKYRLFCWYVEKEEPEKIDPKDDDD